MGVGKLALDMQARFEIGRESIVAFDRTYSNYKLIEDMAGEPIASAFAPNLNVFRA